MGFFSRLFHQLRFITELALITVLTNLMAIVSALLLVQLFNSYVRTMASGLFFTFLLALLMAMLLEFCLRLLRIHIAGLNNQLFNKALSEKIFSIFMRGNLAKLEHLSLSYRQQMLSALRVMQRAYSDTNVAIMLDLPFSFLFIAIIAFIYLPLALVLLLSVMLLLALGKLNIHDTYRAIQPVIESQSSASMLADNAVNQAETIHLFNAASFVSQSWQRLLKQAHQFNHYLQSKQHAIQMLVNTIAAVTMMVVVTISLRLFYRENINVGLFVGMNILSARALMIVVKFNRMSNLLGDAKYALHQLAALQSMPLELKKTSEMQRYQGGISFKALSFSFINSRYTLFESLSLDIKPGQCLVVTGDNASGKTTFLQLILGLLQPVRGQINIDGINLSQLSSEWWRHQLCYLPQNISFIDATIKENIILANPLLDEVALNKIIDQVGLRQYINQCKNGLDEMLYVDDRRLPVGIGQRIALARALVTDGQLVIFDEPFQHLDESGQKMMRSILAYLADKNCTIVIASHDPSVIEYGDYIIDLNVKPVAKIVKSEH